MAATPSLMIDLGTKAPDFSLPNVATGEKVRLADLSGRKALLVMFISRHCPYVQHIKKELTRLGRDYAAREVAMVAICSNDVRNYPDDAPDLLRQMAAEEEFVFPVCYDESQETAKSFSAACTPDFFLFDEKCELAYRGQLDDSRPGNDRPVTGRDLRAALDALLAGIAVPADQKPSIGCNIKWKPGNEPPYFS